MKKLEKEIKWYVPKTFLDFKTIVSKYNINEKRLSETTVKNISVPHWYTYKGIFLPKINVSGIENFIKGNGNIIIEYEEIENNIKTLKNKKKAIKGVEVPESIKDRKKIIKTVTDGINESERIESGITENLMDTDVIDESVIADYDKE